MMNISRITGIVFLIIFLVSHAVCAQEAAATDSFNYYYARNNYAKAIGFWEMFGKDCRDFDLVKNAGNCYYYLNECETAISYYEKARHFIDTDDNDKQIVILMNLGTSYQQLRQFENAKKYLFAAKRLNDLKLSVFISLEKYTSISFQKYTILINYDGFNFLFGGTPKKKIEGARIFSVFFIFEEFFWSLLSDRILHSYLPNGLCV